MGCNSLCNKISAVHNTLLVLAKFNENKDGYHHQKTKLVKTDYSCFDPLRRKLCYNMFEMKFDNDFLTTIFESTSKTQYICKEHHKCD